MLTSNKLFFEQVLVAGQPMWYYILVPKIKVPLYKKYQKGEAFTPSNFGKVILCGYKNEPYPSHKLVIKKLKDQNAI